MSKRPFIMLLLAMACGSSALATNDQLKKLSPELVRQCLAANGKVHRMGLGQFEGCERPMPDAGKVCSDSSECKAGCFFEDRKGGPIPTPRKKITGFCAATDSPFGCRAHVEHSHLGIGVCVD